MLTGHDVMHSASAYALQYISMEESELSERFFMFFLCCTILILFFVFFWPPGGVCLAFVAFVACLPFDSGAFCCCFFAMLILKSIVLFVSP